MKRGRLLQFRLTSASASTTMISREPTIERLGHRPLAAARALRPQRERRWPAPLATIATHRIDDADLYFQYTRSEGWSLEEGIVKSGSFGIDQGVGVRARRAARRPPSPIPTTSPRPRCWTPRAPCARSPPPGRAAASRSAAGVSARRQPRALCAHGPDRHARQHAEGGSCSRRSSSWRARATRASSR